MFYILLLTDSILCLTTSNFLPVIFKDNLNKVKTFDSLLEVELYLHETLTYDDFWSFGLMDPNTEIKLGKIYHRY